MNWKPAPATPLEKIQSLEGELARLRVLAEQARAEVKPATSGWRQLATDLVTAVQEIARDMSTLTEAVTVIKKDISDFRAALLAAKNAPSDEVKQAIADLTAAHTDAQSALAGTGTGGGSGIQP